MWEYHKRVTGSEWNWGESLFQNRPEVGAEKPNRKGSGERSQEGPGSRHEARSARLRGRAFISVNKRQTYIISEAAASNTPSESYG